MIAFVIALVEGVDGVEFAIKSCFVGIESEMFSSEFARTRIMSALS